MSQIQFTERLTSDPDAYAFLCALRREQVSRYGFADPAELDASEYTPPNGIFVVVRQGTTAAGCGGYRWFDRATQTVEIKRIYIVPASRGHGAGRALLSWLEHHAVAAGAQRAILETGVRNTAAISLFTNVGYRPVDRYVEGRDPEINRAFARLLTSS
jgi:GNAT superfamily N-acetyltransferase